MEINIHAVVHTHDLPNILSSVPHSQGKVKGIERILGAVDTLEQSLMEVSSGSAKYEHHHRAIAWRIHRLPKEGQG